METDSIREQLHQYINKSDEKLLRLMYALAKEYNDDDLDYEFTEDDIGLFNERKNKRTVGESKTYSWQEAKKIITGQKSIE
jgi:hypothetical protein